MPANKFSSIYSTYVVDRTEEWCYIKDVNPSNLLGIKKRKKKTMKDQTTKYQNTK